MDSATRFSISVFFLNRVVSNFFENSRRYSQLKVHMANLLPVSLIPVVHLVLRIYPQIVEKVRDDHHVIFMGLGEDDP
jgi:hypothetical protein